MPTIYHTYASVADLRDFLAGTNYSSNWTADTSALRRILASASRRIDDYVGADGLNTFGPYIETKKYDIGIGPLGQTLVQTGLRNTGLRNDVRPITAVNTMAPAAKVVNIIPLGSWLSSATTVTSYKDTARTSSETLTEGYDEDYFLEPYNTTPKYTLKMNEDSAKGFYGGQQTLHIAATWGWQDTTTTPTTINANITSTSATSVSVTSASDLSEGNTILIDTEQMYVESISSTTLTVIRGVHGTTAATHTSGADVKKYTYPDDVVQACLDLGHFSYRDRDIGFNDRIETAPATDAMTTLRTLDRYVSHSNSAGVVF
jgi:hypothetical protein